MIPCERCDLVRALSPLPCKGVGRHREAPMWYGISLDSSWQDHQGGDGIQAYCGVGTPTPGMPSLLGWGGKETHPTDWHRQYWAHTFVQLNEGTLYVPLSSEGHISTMINAGATRVSRRLKQGTRASAALHPTTAWNINTLSRPVHKSSQLQMDFPQAMPSDKIPFIPGPCKTSTLPSSPCLPVECPSKGSNCTSMATELQELLSWMVLDTYSPASGDSTPRRPISAAQVAPSTIRVEDLLRPDRPVSATPELVATSQQASLQAARPDEAVPISHSPSPTLALETPKVTSVPTTPQPGTCSGIDLSVLSNEVFQ